MTLVTLLVLAGTKFVGGGLEIGSTAPIYSPFIERDASDAVQVSQIYYTQAELGFAANTRIIDVAWRKEDLGPTTGNGGCAVQVYLKNVSRQTGPFTVGSSTTLVDALDDAQKVIDKPASALPSTMGFVTLDAVENQFSFIYSGDSLEVTIITDCRGAAMPATDAPIRWRYDEVPERVRVASGANTDAMTLRAEPVLSSWRPHTRFRTLVDTPKCEIRVGLNVLPNGGTFGLAPNHLAVAVPGAFAFQVVNESTTPFTVNGLSATTMNGTAITTGATFPFVVAAGSSVATPVIFTADTASLSRFSLTWDTTIGAQTATFQGTATATAMPTPFAAVLKADNTQQALTNGMTYVVPLGTVPANFTLEQLIQAGNYGQTTIAVDASVTSGPGEIRSASFMAGHQQETIVRTRITTPSTAGAFSTVVRVTVGNSIFTVRYEGTVVAAPDLAVSRTVDGLELMSGDTDTFTRPGRAATTREYTLRNVGSAPLHIRAAFHSYGVALRRYDEKPLLILPGGAVNVTMWLLAFDVDEPTVNSRVLSDDPDERVFTWITRGLVEGGPKLNATFQGDDGTGTFTRAPASLLDADADIGGAQFTITLANSGTSALTISELELNCVGCNLDAAPTLPLVLEPGATHVIFGAQNSGAPPKEAADVQAAYVLSGKIVSDDPASPLIISAKAPGRRITCSVSGGPALALLGLLMLHSRRRRTVRNNSVFR